MHSPSPPAPGMRYCARRIGDAVGSSRHAEGTVQRNPAVPPLPWPVCAIACSRASPAPAIEPTIAARISQRMASVPQVREQWRTQVALAEGRDDHHDELAGTLRTTGHLECGPDGRARGDPHEQAL